MIHFVLDACVAAKWFLPPDDEDLVPQAFSLFRRYEVGEIAFIVPDIFWAEFGNIAWKAVRRQRWPVSTALTSIDRLRACDFSTLASKSLLQSAFEISSEYGRSVYDSLYIALAKETRLEMITADERLVNAMGSRFPVRWLGAFSIR